MTRLSETAAATPRTDEATALDLDQRDPLQRFREEFHLPHGADGRPLIYFCGNSLGLQPKAARALLEEELDDWAALGVEGHFHAKRPWYPYHEQLRAPGARLVGGHTDEVVFMNSLTVNLHLLLASFYRPTAERYQILIEDGAFPSDTYVAQTQLAWNGINPADGLVLARPRSGEYCLRTEDLEQLIQRAGSRLALVLLPGVQYFTGQTLDMARITAAAQRVGAIAGFDLAHAIGNVPLALHEWQVDFAAWCSYKYLNAGPGAIAGAFVHRRHAQDTSRVRLGGWWGNDPATRFRMHLEDRFQPLPSADGWQLSNPPIFSMTPLIASLRLFDEATVAALREKSLRLTRYMRGLIEQTVAGSRARIEVITPTEPEAHGAQLSLVVHGAGKRLQENLQQAGVISDFRPPNVVRVAPAPLYNTFHEVWRFVRILRGVADAE